MQTDSPIYHFLHILTYYSEYKCYTLTDYNPLYLIYFYDNYESYCLVTRSLYTMIAYYNPGNGKLIR